MDKIGVTTRREFPALRLRNSNRVRIRTPELHDHDLLCSSGIFGGRASRSRRCVIVGGGIIGVSAPLHLAKKGVSVTLCEKGRIAGEQSSRNWGWCRTMGRQPAEIPLSVESLRMWAGMNQEVGAETGFRSSGIIYLCESQKDLGLSMVPRRLRRSGFSIPPR